MENISENINENQSEITMDLIVSVFSKKTEEKTLSQIKDGVIDKLRGDSLLIDGLDEKLRDIERLIKEDKKLGDESFLIYTPRKKYKQRPIKQVIGSDVLCQNNDYIGRAGELAVMSELVFNGYNANRMMIDEGIDIIAAKNNMYYYVQVKTVAARDGRIYAQIKKQRFDQYIDTNIRYYIVSRYKKGEDVKNIFFMFTSKDLDKYTYDKCIKRTNDNISIKIRFHERSGEPILYDEREANIGWHMNNFEL